MLYPIWYKEQKIGVANLSECGLYVEVVCSCRFPEKSFSRICMQYADKSIDLGLWVLEGKEFVVRKKIPAKQLGEGEPVFRLTETAFASDKGKLQILRGMPFVEIHKLRHGKLLIQSGKIYLVDQSTR